MRILLAVAIALVGAVSLGVVATTAQSPDPDELRVTLRDGTGAVVGVVKLRQAGGTVDIKTNTQRGLSSDWHGFHVHAVGKCEGPSFSSAGGHLKADGQGHSDHIGDLAPLLVKLNGTSTSRVTTDRFRVADLRDADGSALIVHLGPDNFANVPPRYAPGGPDQDTLNTGDSGGRAACGLIEAGA